MFDRRTIQCEMAPVVAEESSRYGSRQGASLQLADHPRPKSDVPLYQSLFQPGCKTPGKVALGAAPINPVPPGP